MKEKSSVISAWPGNSLQCQIVIGGIEKQAGLFLMEGGVGLIEKVLS